MAKSSKQQSVITEGVILGWNRDNPNAWPLDDYEAARAEIDSRGHSDGFWSVGRRANIEVGTQCFLLVQGRRHGRGLVGYGRVTEKPFVDTHYEDSSKLTHYVGVRWLELSPVDDVVAVPELHRREPSIPWLKGIRGSGFPVAPEALDRVYEVWRASAPDAEERSPGELEPGECWEGSVRTIRVNRYERDPRARSVCLAHHGNRAQPATWISQRSTVRSWADELSMSITWSR